MRASDIDVVILAGGGGTRLWPLSRAQRPKQFLPLPFGVSLLEQAVLRALTVTDARHVWIVTLATQVKQTLAALPQFPRSQILAEPLGRNSGPACAFATLYLQRQTGEDRTLLVITADHFIPDLPRFKKAALHAVSRASEGESLVTFGLKPTSPRTDFGYIEASKSAKRGTLRKVKRFVEKPTLARAKSFLKSKCFYWNSGMFAWRSDVFLRELQSHSPAIHRILSNVRNLDDRHGGEFAKAYKRIPNLSVDYAVMEKSRVVEVIPAAFRWSDLGTWSALHEVLSKGKTPNVVVGQGEVVDGKGNLIYSDQKPFVLYGVDQLVVVDTPSVALITTREHSKDLKKLLEKSKNYYSV